jgi:plasmid stabilization system protein ParE
MFTILIEDRALKDIQAIIDYYDSQQQGVGLKFKKAIDKEFLHLKKNPFFRIMYKNVRCRAVKKFPFLIHYSIDEGAAIVFIMAVISIHRNPAASWL